MMEPTRVLTVCGARWPMRKQGKRANLADPLLGDDCSWADMMDVYEATAVQIVMRMLARTDWRKRETIAMRRILDACFRNASEPANFYSMPLYVSGGMLLQFEKTMAEGGKWHAGHAEHVLPLAIYASGTNLLADPARHIPNLRKALVGPICLMTGKEHEDIETKTHPDPGLPFLRYRGIVDAYRVVDGAWVDPDRWTFQDHIEHMKVFPAYRTGAERYERDADMWAEALSTIALRQAA